jgi:hypothetical protein
LENRSQETEWLIVASKKVRPVAKPTGIANNAT